MSDELKAARELEILIDASHEEWDSNGCNDPGCGCITVYLKKHLVPNILSRDKLIEEAALRRALLKSQTPTPSGNGNFQLGFLVGQIASQTAIEALISAPGALAEALRKAHEDGANWMLDEIRGDLRVYPNGGGDSEVMKEVDRIKADHDREIERKARQPLIAALKAALPRLAHNLPDCMVCRPAAEWGGPDGQYDTSGCHCEIAIIKAALRAEEGTGK